MSQNDRAVDRNVAYRRHNGQRGPARQRILLVCEGKKTEPAYFRAFHLSNVTIEGVGMNTQSLVQRAVELRDEALRERRGYNAIWCVFDRDSFPADVFNQALALAQKNEFEVAYSNEAFELWYLLHFHYYQQASSRNQYEHLLSTLLTHPYPKNSETMYDELLPRQKTAIRNAEKLLALGSGNPERDNPSTTVHKLVEVLNRYVRN